MYQSQNAAALWRVCCENCDAGPHSFIGKDAAIKNWNTRAAAPVVAEQEIGMLREKLSAALSGGLQHMSDCAVNCAPAYEPTACDCPVGVKADDDAYDLVRRIREHNGWTPILNDSEAIALAKAFLGRATQPASSAVRQALEAVDVLWSKDAAMGFEQEMNAQSRVGKVWALVRKALSSEGTKDLIADISEMASRVGVEFVPDKSKIAAYEAAHPSDTPRSDAPDLPTSGWRKAVFTYSDDPVGGHLYYFGPQTTTPGPYREQRHVKAIVDIASDGSFAGVELIDNMPPLTKGGTP